MADVHEQLSLKCEISYVLSSDTKTIETIQENKLDIILLNIHLSNSIDVMDTVLEMQKHKNIPIIYITNFFDDKGILKTLKTEPLGYLQKPFKNDDLKSILTLALHKIDLTDKSIQNTHLTHLDFDYCYDLEKENLYFKKLPSFVFSSRRVFIIACCCSVIFSSLEDSKIFLYSFNNSCLYSLIISFL